MSCFDINKKRGSQRIYRCWQAMRARCFYSKDKRFHRYGGRGIGICKEWDDFLIFVKWADESGYERNLTLDRKENNENYGPENCTWSSLKEQCQNTSQSKIWIVNGLEFNSSQDAADHFNVSRKTICSWCNGKYGKVYSYPPKPNCSSELRYVKE